MGRERFVEATRDLRRVALDTSACIYFLGDEPRRAEFVAALIERAGARDLAIDLPGIVLLELFVRPFKSGAPAEIELMKQFTRQPGFESTEMREDVLMLSAQIRALTSLKAPDALVVGSAAWSHCGAIVGNDERFRRLSELENVTLVSSRRRVPIPHYLHLDDFV